ncbi:MAG TPA: hypothetical protein DCM86_04945 [Verrucomicrobiales bacterium]|nr:hypothetical protein [Verrucomicrobiales bacterium]
MSPVEKPNPEPEAAVRAARFVADRLPPGGLFKDQGWRVAPAPFPLSADLVRELEGLGRVLLQFYKAINLLHRQSRAGRQPGWVAQLYDQGKPASLLGWQEHPAFKSELPRVIRPDLLLTEEGFAITELDSVPGGIGLTAWLNQTYSALAPDAASRLVGGAEGMLRGFARIFGDARQAHLIVSEESASYRPEMEWIASRLPGVSASVRGADFTGWGEGDAVYRFFELFDLANIPCGEPLVAAAAERRVRLTAPFKPCLEEKLSMALLWNRNLRGFWRQELGEGFLQRLQRRIPYSWVVDPTPLPPHGAIPGLELTGWDQLKSLSQRDRDLILKVSGYSERAWGARGVYLGSDLSSAEWSVAVDEAIAGFDRSPYILQRYQKPKVVDFAYVDLEAGRLVPMASRVRLCPYYFVVGEGDAARAELAGVLATACPADKKIIHGMRDAVLAPCALGG